MKIPAPAPLMKHVEAPGFARPAGITTRACQRSRCAWRATGEIQRYWMAQERLTIQMRETLCRQETCPHQQCAVVFAWFVNVPSVEGARQGRRPPCERRGLGARAFRRRPWHPRCTRRIGRRGDR